MSSIHVDGICTGDLILTRPTSASNESWWLKLYGFLIQRVTKSPYTHAAIAIRNPAWLDETLAPGLYVYESSLEPSVDPIQHRKIVGVQLTPWAEFCQSNNAIYVRKQLNPNAFDGAIFQKMHRDIYGVPYDAWPGDLWRAAMQTQPDARKQHTDYFFCSALVGYIAVLQGWLPSETDWSEVLPGQLSSDSNALAWDDGRCLWKHDELVDIRP